MQKFVILILCSFLFLKLVDLGYGNQLKVSHKIAVKSSVGKRNEPSPSCSSPIHSDCIVPYNYGNATLQNQTFCQGGNAFIDSGEVDGSSCSDLTYCGEEIYFIYNDTNAADNVIQVGSGIGSYLSVSSGSAEIIQDQGTDGFLSLSSNAPLELQSLNYRFCIGAINIMFPQDGNLTIEAAYARADTVYSVGVSSSAGSSSPSAREWYLRNNQATTGNWYRLDIGKCDFYTLLFTSSSTVYIEFLDISVLGTTCPDQPSDTQSPSTTLEPTTQLPTTQEPTTPAPTTPAPTTQSPTTQAPSTQAPTTQAPTTQDQTTQAPATQAPSPTQEQTSGDGDDRLGGGDGGEWGGNVDPTTRAPFCSDFVPGHECPDPSYDFLRDSTENATHHTIEQVLNGLTIFSSESEKKYINPFVTCGHRLPHSDYCLSVFGYENPSNNTVSYISSPHYNFISPDPWYRGQPNLFYPGKHEEVFGVVWHCVKYSRRFAVWTLTTNTTKGFISKAATATRGLSNCKPEQISKWL